MSQRATMIVLISMTVVWGLGAVMGVMPALMSPMMFDAPGSERNPATIAFCIAVASFPIVCVGAIVISWICFAFRWRVLAYVAACLPLLNVCAAVSAVVWLEMFNSGGLAG